MGEQKAKIKLRAFRLTQKTDINSQHDELIDKIYEKYDKTHVKERMLKRSTNDEDKEHDLIPLAAYDHGTLFGIMLRVELDSKSPKIPSNLLNLQSFSIKDMPTDEQNSTVYKKHYYFCLDHAHMVTNLPGNTTVVGFQTYINWFLESATMPYEFTPLYQSTPDVKLSDIREVVFEDDSVMLSSNKESMTTAEDTQNKLIDIAWSTIKNILNDTIDLTEEELKSIVSARLLLKLKKPKSMSEDDYQNKLGAVMKPVSDVGYVHYVAKNGQRISAEELAVVKCVEIEKTDKGFFDEEQLRQAMISFLSEV